MTQAQAHYAVKDWHRRKWDDQPKTPGAHVFRIELISAYTGDIEAESSFQILITQNEDGTGNLVGLEKVTGSVHGKSGSFVFQHTGTFDNGKIHETLLVMPGSGTGELAGISGQVAIALDEHGESFPVTFDYQIAETA
jgi:hypothetical protein